MQYIAALDYEHLDNGLFLTGLAQSLSKQKNTRPIIVHGDSAYTERIMQSGVMRSEAQIRSIKDLNHRLVALFADEGISAVGLNGYQRKFISLQDDTLALDGDFFNRLPRQSALVLSTLVWDVQTQAAHAISLSRMVSFFQETVEVDGVFAFSSAERDEVIKRDFPAKLQWQDLPPGFAKQCLPTEFHQYNDPIYLSTARTFHLLPDTKKTTYID